MAIERPAGMPDLRQAADPLAGGAEMKAHTLWPLSNGGFLVEVCGDSVFASTTLDEALRYIRSKLIPPEPMAVDPEVTTAQHRWDTMFSQNDPYAAGRMAPNPYTALNKIMGTK